MQKRQLTFEAIGTQWDIHIKSDIVDSIWKDLERAIKQRTEAFDESYSRFRDDSLVTKMAKQGGTFQLPEDAYPMLSFYKQLYDVTKGKVTPLIGQVISDAGYDASYSLQSKDLQLPPAWEDVIDYDKHKLTLQIPALLDFGAAGKGYLVDQVGGILEEAGVQNYHVNAGGDMIYRTNGKSPLRVGLENPNDHSQVVGVATIVNQSLCASSGSRRKWGQYHHIIDPVSLQSPKHILATWVVAEDTMTADGLATALYFVDPIDLLKQFKFNYALLSSDMSLQYNRDFPVRIYTDDSK